MYNNRPFLQRIRLSVVLLIGLFCCEHGLAQFYTGSEMTFGRKRVQYEKFFWMYYRFDGFDVYFNRNGKNLALYTANYIQNHLSEMEKLMGFQSQQGLRFIVFNRLSDYKQSNIGYLDEASEVGYNTGGITRFLGNKVFLYFNGNYVDFEKQIRQGIAELLLAQAIQGTKVGTQYKNSYLMDLPYWFTGGLASYLTHPWDEIMDERMQEAIQQKNYKYISGLEGEEAAFAGHSFWYFVAQTYGEEAIPRCIRVVASERKLEKTFNIALNVKFKILMKQWRDFYLQENSKILRDSIVYKEILKNTNRTDRTYDHFVLNPYGKEAAFVSNHLGLAKVFIQTLNPPQRHCIYRIGASINDKPDYSFPILAWHPNGHILGIIVEEKGRTTLILYDLQKKHKKAAFRYPIEIFDKVTGFSFSKDGRSIAVAASSNGQSDIYLFHLGAGTTKQITFDIYDDQNPIFIPETDFLVFSSNRPNDSIKKNEKFEIAPSLPLGHNLFAYDLKQNENILVGLTKENPLVSLSQPRPLGPQMLAYLNNAFGETNLSVGKFGKTISQIDTAIHYRNTFHSGMVSDYPGGLLSIDIAPNRGEYAQVRKDHGRYVLGIQNLEPIAKQTEVIPIPSKTIQPTKYKAQVLKRQEEKQKKQFYLDSLSRAATKDTTGKAKEILQKSLYVQSFLKLRNAEVSDLNRLSDYDIWLLKRYGFWENTRGQAADSVRVILCDTSKKEQLTEVCTRGQAADLDSILLSPNHPLYKTLCKFNGRYSKYTDTNYIQDSLDRRFFSSNQDSVMEINFPKIAPKQNIYNVEYSINQATAQLGFNYLNACYQAFTNASGPLYLNSNVNGFAQISITDLMENHRFIGGVSISFDLTNTEYLFSYENMERRLGHQFVFHMANYNQNRIFPPYKQNTFDMYYIIKYPITPVSQLRGTIFARYDRTILKSFEYQTLVEPTYRSTRVGLKAEWVYDHSRFISQNIYFGTRGKVWFEYYQGIIHSKDNLFVVGVDFRDYRRLYKTLIWANRIAISSSFGQSKLVYYMGGVDNWIAPRFNRDVQTDPNQHYAYQTLATNMRGFIQNIRNGNTFAVLNSEIRFPIFQVLSPMPVKSAFLRHLQLIIFGDVGSAWSNWNPWSKDNLFYKQTIVDNKLTIELDKDANPFVGGFGFGLRCQLLGYFIRGDLAWGVENGIVHKKPVFYFSFCTDF
ncbi:MAG: hypothetical protein RR333_02380 [Bacteroidales bacterium]